MSQDDHKGVSPHCRSIERGSIYPERDPSKLGWLDSGGPSIPVDLDWGSKCTGGPTILQHWHHNEHTRTNQIAAFVTIMV